MSDPKPARPSQVTVAGWMVVAGSVVVVLTAFSEVAGLRSLETREAVEAALSEPPVDRLGLGLQDALGLMRISYMVAAASAAASAILGWQVLQRSRGARVALSLLAVPLFVSGLVQGGFASAVVSAAIVMLWFQPARDWFNGITRPARPSPPEPSTVPHPRPQGGDDVALSRTTPAPPSPTGRDALLDLPPPTAPPLHPTPYADRPVAAAAPAPRPAATTWACVLTWLGAGAVFGLITLVLLAVLVDPGILADARRQNPDLAGADLSDDFLRNSVYVTAALALPWSAAAAALAVLAWRRIRWAAAGLVGCATTAGLLCLLAMAGSFLFVLPGVGCAVTVGLLLRPESRAWLRGSRAGR